MAHELWLTRLGLTDPFALMQPVAVLVVSSHQPEALETCCSQSAEGGEVGRRSHPPCPQTSRWKNFPGGLVLASAPLPLLFFESEII